MAKNAKKKAENVGKEVKHHRRADVLHVSKSAKIMAAFASLRGFSFRQTIRALGEAEAEYKKNGRLILGGKAD